MNTRLIAPLCLTILLGGCGGDQFEDLQAWMATTGNDGAGKVEPLPPVKQVEAFEYNPANLQDPFQPRNLMPTSKGGLQPDLARPKQPLEEFPLDALRMVGTITRPGKQLLAVIKDPKGVLHTVQTGDHIGQNFGTIEKITNDEVDIKELTPDGSGGWVSSKANMTLTEEAAK